MRLLQALIAFSAIAYAYYAWRTKIPLVWTQAPARKIILDLVRAELAARPGQKVKIYDLGAGLGGLCFALARAFPEAEIVGIEMGWPIWLCAGLRRVFSRRRNLRFVCRDFWKQDIGDGDIVVCYLGDVLMARLKNKLLAEARPGRLFITNTFPLPRDWPPERRIPAGASLSKEIFVYRQGG